MALNLRCFPSSDADFEAVARSVVDLELTSNSPRACEEDLLRAAQRLRERYPQCVLAPRNSLAEFEHVDQPTWYAYRDGRIR